jgi:hypothetical protein
MKIKQGGVVIEDTDLPNTFSVDNYTPRNKPGYKGMWERQTKNSKILLGGLCITTTLTFCIGVGSSILFNQLRHDLEVSNGHITRMATMYGVADSQYHSALENPVIKYEIPKTIEGQIEMVFGVDAEDAKKVFTCESHLKANAVNNKNRNGSIDIGVAQINSVHSIPDAYLKNSMINLLVAKQIFDRQGWQPWTCRKVLN